MRTYNEKLKAHIQACHVTISDLIDVKSQVRSHIMEFIPIQLHCRTRWRHSIPCLRTLVARSLRNLRLNRTLVAKYLTKYLM